MIRPLVLLALLFLVGSAIAADSPRRLFLAERGADPVLIDIDGNVVCAPKAVAVWGLAEGLFVYSDGKRVGYMDETGKVIVPAQFIYAEAFSQGLAEVEFAENPRTDEERWGYIDRNGRQVIAPRYWATFPFAEGRAIALSKRGGLTFLDERGQVIAEKQFDWADGFSDGLAPVQKKYMWGYADPSGRLAIPCVYAWARPFSEGLAPVAVWSEDVGKHELGVPIVGSGFIDKTNAMVIEPKYSSTDSFSCGLALVSIGNVYVSSNNHLGREVRIGKRMFIDRTGATVFEVDPSVVRISGFRDDLVYVLYEDGRQGYLDRTGKLAFLLGPDVESGWDFDGGLARVTMKGGGTGYVNRAGKLVWPRK